MLGSTALLVGVAVFLIAQEDGCNSDENGEGTGDTAPATETATPEQATDDDDTGAPYLEDEDELTTVRGVASGTVLALYLTEEGRALPDFVESVRYSCDESEAWSQRPEVTADELEDWVHLAEVCRILLVDGELDGAAKRLDELLRNSE